MKRIRKVRQQVREAMRGGTQEWSQVVTGMLADHRRGIRGELNTMFGRLRENGSPENGDVMDWAAFGYDRELGSARVNHVSQTLRQIDQAIARHAQGRYGLRALQRKNPTRAIALAALCAFLSGVPGLPGTAGVGTTGGGRSMSTWIRETAAILFRIGTQVTVQ